MNEDFIIDPEFESLLEAQGLSDLDSVFEWNQGLRLDKQGLESWRQRWRLQVQDSEGVKHILYLKRFDKPPLRRQIGRWCNGHSSVSTAGIEWNNARALAEAEISVALPIAFGERMKGVWEQRSFIILRQVTGESLETWVPKHIPPLYKENKRLRRRKRFDRLADYVAAFHQAGFVHRDLYLCHLFITGGDKCLGELADEHFTMIDLQRVFRPRWRHRRWVVKDLAALNFSTPMELVGQWERLRFLCRYVRQCSQFGSARKLARLIENKTKRIARRNPSPKVDAKT